MSYASGSITPTTQGQAQFWTLEGDNAFFQRVYQDLLNQTQSLSMSASPNTDQIMHYCLQLEQLKPLIALSPNQRGEIVFEMHYQEDITNPNHNARGTLADLYFKNGLHPLTHPQNNNAPYALHNTNLAITDQRPIVKRFGINPTHVASIANYGIAGDQLHYIEQAVLRKAIAELNGKLCAEDYANSAEKSKGEFAHNVVIVDIFTRDPGFIQKPISTHSIVLWKSRCGEIILIDPSQTKFSTHICRALNKDKARFALTEEVKTLLPVTSIYSSDSTKVGFSDYFADNPLCRDCIDIAVKIAFEINEQQLQGTVVQNIRKATFEVISNLNNKENLHNKSIPKDRTYIRELQSSNKSVRHKAIALLNYLKTLNLNVNNVITKNKKIPDSSISAIANYLNNNQVQI